jgi:hypothetical protein
VSGLEDRRAAAATKVLASLSVAFAETADGTFLSLCVLFWRKRRKPETDDLNGNSNMQDGERRRLLAVLSGESESDDGGSERDGDLPPGTPADGDAGAATKNDDGGSEKARRATTRETRHRHGTSGVLRDLLARESDSDNDDNGDNGDLSDSGGEMSDSHTHRSVDTEGRGLQDLHHQARDAFESMFSTDAGARESFDIRYGEVCDRMQEAFVEFGVEIHETQFDNLIAEARKKYGSLINQEAFEALFFHAHDLFRRGEKVRLFVFLLLFSFFSSLSLS